MQKSKGRITIIILSLFFITGFFVSCSRPPVKLEKSTIKLPDISGMAIYDHQSYLVVHDIKSHEVKPRLGILTVKNGKDQTLAPVGIDWSSLPRKGNDLESVCAVPGKPGEYLAAESGYYKPNTGPVIHGTIYHILISKNQSGRFIGKVLQVIQFPDNLKQVEGIACLPVSEKGYTVILAERGARGYQGIIPGTLHWDYLSLEKFQTEKQSFSPQGSVSFLTGDTDWCKSADTRSCSDIFIDNQQRLWISSTQDGGDNGPFRSVIYLAGKARPGANEPVELFPEPHVAWKVEGFKVEAISGINKTSAKDNHCPLGLSLGTDDEAFGGTWRNLVIPIAIEEIQSPLKE